MQALALFQIDNFIKSGSQRNTILKEIYHFYERDGINRKKENWKRYIKWLKENKFPDSKENQVKFKKSRFFIKLLPARVIAIKLSHIKTNDLYYMLSVAKDKYNRGENVGAFLLGSIKWES